MPKNTDFMSAAVIGGWRTLLPLLVGFFLLCSGALLMGNDRTTLPRVPSPGEGRVYPLREHEVVVYANLQEALSVYGLLISGLAVGGLGVAYEKRARSQRKGINA